MSLRLLDDVRVLRYICHTCGHVTAGAATARAAVRAAAEHQAVEHGRRHNWREHVTVEIRPGRPPHPSLW